MLLFIAFSVIFIKQIMSLNVFVSYVFLAHFSFYPWWGSLKILKQEVVDSLKKIWMFTNGGNATPRSKILI